MQFSIRAVHHSVPYFTLSPAIPVHPFTPDGSNLASGLMQLIMASRNGPLQLSGGGEARPWVCCIEFMFNVSVQ